MDGEREEMVWARPRRACESCKGYGFYSEVETI